MLLAADIGNTNTVLGIADSEGAWTTLWRITTQRSATSDDWAALVLPLALRDATDLSSIDSAAVGSVVPVATAGFVDFMERSIGVVPLVIRSELDLGIRLGMDNPGEVGADRIANAVAAWSQHGAASIIVDLGTATKVEAIDGSGTFLGGAIAPGLGVSLEALTARAARLYAIELKEPASAIGRNTVAAMQAGLVRGHAHMVRGLIGDISTEIGERAQVIVTGGNANAVLPSLGERAMHLPDLTLDGIRYIFMRNQRTDST